MAQETQSVIDKLTEIAVGQRGDEQKSPGTIQYTYALTEDGKRLVRPYGAAILNRQVKKVEQTEIQPGQTIYHGKEIWHRYQDGRVAVLVPQYQLSQIAKEAQTAMLATRQDMWDIINPGMRPVIMTGRPNENLVQVSVPFDPDKLDELAGCVHLLHHASLRQPEFYQRHFGEATPEEILTLAQEHIKQIGATFYVTADGGINMRKPWPLESPPPVPPQAYPIF